MSEAVILSAELRGRLRRSLESLDGVVGVVIDGERASIHLILEPEAETAPLEPLVRERIMAEGVDPGRLALEFVARPGGGVRRRVRFQGIERIPDGAGMTTMRVTLEWHGREIVGEASGDTTETIELRSAAAATILAVESLLGVEIGLRLTGVKRTRAFDTELIITSVHRTKPPQQHYVGAAIVRSDPVQSTALSILHALNRMMGNFLATSD